MSAEENIIPAIVTGANGPAAPEINDDNESMEVGDPSLDDMLRSEENNIAKEKETMEALCAKVATLGHPPAGGNDQADTVFRHVCLILTDRDRGKTEYEYKGLLIKYIYLNTPSVAETKTAVLDLLADPVPKSIILFCFNHFILVKGCASSKGSADEAMNALKDISFRMMSNTRHNLVISSSPFPPSCEIGWPWISGYNLFVRNLCITMRRNPLSCHKALLKKVKSLTKLAVKGDMWQEHKDGTGLGTTLSEQGWSKLDAWFGETLLKGMSENVDHNTGLGSEVGPAPLCQSPGYRSQTMVKLLIEQGTYNPVPVHYKKTSWNYRYRSGRDLGLPHDDLRPSLASIGRRQSHASSSSSESKKSQNSYRSQYSRGNTDRRASNHSVEYNGERAGDRYTRDDVFDAVKMDRVERDNADLINVNQRLKEEKEKEIKKRRAIEDRLCERNERLQSELEWQSKDRRNLEKMLMKMKDELRMLREEKVEIRDELRRERKKSKED